MEAVMIVKLNSPFGMQLSLALRHPVICSPLWSGRSTCYLFVDGDRDAQEIRNLLTGLHHERYRTKNFYPQVEELIHFATHMKAFLIVCNKRQIKILMSENAAAFDEIKLRPRKVGKLVRSYTGEPRFRLLGLTA